MLRDECSHEKIGRLPSIVRCPFANVKEHREAIVLTTDPAWRAVSGIDVNTQHPIYVKGNTQADMAALTEKCEGEVVYGIGGGLAIDTAKYVAAAKEMPLVAVPTLLSTDAFLTNATGVREKWVCPLSSDKSTGHCYCRYGGFAQRPCCHAGKRCGGCPLNCDSTLGLAGIGEDGCEPIGSTVDTASG